MFCLPLYSLLTLPGTELRAKKNWLNKLKHVPLESGFGLLEIYGNITKHEEIYQMPLLLSVTTYFYNRNLSILELSAP